MKSNDGTKKRSGKKLHFRHKKRCREKSEKKDTVEKNQICMQQHNKNKADSYEKLETVANKQTSEA